jgi:hypothetical protein
MRYGKEMSRSKFFRYKSNASKIIKEADEDHLKSEIATRSNGKIRWTYLLLTTLANQKRVKEPYSSMEVLKKYVFSHQYWGKFMIRQNLQ